MKAIEITYEQAKKYLPVNKMVRTGHGDRVKSIISENLVIIDSGETKINEKLFVSSLKKLTL